VYRGAHRSRFRGSGGKRKREMSHIRWRGEANTSVSTPLEEVTSFLPAPRRPPPVTVPPFQARLICARLHALPVYRLSCCSNVRCAWLPCRSPPAATAAQMPAARHVMKPAKGDDHDRGRRMSALFDREAWQRRARRVRARRQPDYVSQTRHRKNANASLSPFPGWQAPFF